jgi:SagB-type dehydrogenase family enzyme
MFMSKDISRRDFLKSSAATGALFMASGPSITMARELKPIELPKPQTEGGKPLMQALRDRKTWRAYTTDKIPLQVLSSLLWAAFGINRPESGKHTAPTGGNQQSIDIFVATDEGVYVYNSKSNMLTPVLAEDVRSISGRQTPSVPLDDAPVNLIYVADLSKHTKEIAIYLSFAHTGFISQNVYLYCASEGLATVVRAWFDKAALEKKLNLRTDQYITLCQSVGYPRKT